MFTGIIESTGIVENVETSGSGKVFYLSSSLAPELKIDQSISHNGACLTVEEISGNIHRVTAVQETLAKTELGNWKTGTLVNLERCMQLNGRLDGHIVQGHVDGTATCISRRDLDGSWEFRFRFPREFAALVIEKGSICLNGISLTCFDITDQELSVAIIPYTFNHTNINLIKPGDPVNVEFDILGKYIQRRLVLAS